MPNTTHNIIAVVVTHNITRDFITYCNTLLPQTQHIIITDNASNTASLALLTTYANNHKDHITLIQNDANLGLSKAQNQGIQNAFTHHQPDWVLLLDDDSEAAPDMTQQMLHALTLTPNHSNIGLITPQIIDRHSHHSYPCLLETSRFTFERRNITLPPYNEEPYVENLFCALASGSLIKREVFETIGLMNEAFFIDFIDWDFALRLQKADYAILCATRAILHHSIGNRSQHHILGKTLSTTNQPPHRRYSSAKNRVIFWRLYCKTRPAIFFYTFMSLKLEGILILLCEKQKFVKIWQMIKGFLAGLFATKTPHIPTLPKK